jgi:hypothetical protein
MTMGVWTCQACGDPIHGTHSTQLSHNTSCSNVHRQPTYPSADSVAAFYAWCQNSSCNMQALLVMCVIALVGVLETQQRLV